LSDLVIDGVNGYLIDTRNPVDLAEKIELVYRGEFVDIRANLNQEYTLETMVARTLQIYRDLL
jgi:glycosyltransferase involved in cell wall biosynthesis